MYHCCWNWSPSDAGLVSFETFLFPSADIPWSLSGWQDVMQTMSVFTIYEILFLKSAKVFVTYNNIWFTKLVEWVRDDCCARRKTLGFIDQDIGSPKLEEVCFSFNHFWEKLMCLLMYIMWYEGSSPCAVNREKCSSLGRTLLPNLPLFSL